MKNFLIPMGFLFTFAVLAISIRWHVSNHGGFTVGAFLFVLSSVWTWSLILYFEYRRKSGIDNDPPSARACQHRRLDKIHKGEIEMNRIPYLLLAVISIMVGPAVYLATGKLNPFLQVFVVILFYFFLKKYYQQKNQTLKHRTSKQDP